MYIRASYDSIVLLKFYQKLRKWLIGDYLAEQQDIYQQSKAILLFNASLLVLIVMIPLLLYIAINGLYGKSLPSLLGLAFIFLQFYIFKRFRSIWWPAFILCLLVSLIVCFNINFNNETIHIVEPFWMIVIVVFAVFMIGVKWAIFISMVLMVGFSFFVVNKLEDNLREFIDLIPSIKYFIIVEISAALIVLIYILSFFVATTKRAEHALRTGNWLLEENHNLVKKQNSEITVLLKEIHHRVKNNLQVVNSLLRLQSVQIDDERSREVFEDAQHRIKAIALIHERMYKSPDLSNIDSEGYFRGLAEDLLRQSSVNQSISLNIHIQLAKWSQDIVVPMGLLLNELIANSVEHGKLGDDGVIRIELTEQEEGCRLIYSDNGVGFNEGSTSGFGLELIQTLCEQLNGQMERFNYPGKGLEYRFEFRQ